MNAKIAEKMATSLTEKYDESACISLDCMAYDHDKANPGIKYFFYIADVFHSHVDTWQEVVDLYNEYMGGEI